MKTGAMVSWCHAVNDDDVANLYLYTILNTFHLAQMERTPRKCQKIQDMEQN